MGLAVTAESTSGAISWGRAVECLSRMTECACDKLQDAAGSEEMATGRVMTEREGDF